MQKNLFNWSVLLVFLLGLQAVNLQAAEPSKVLKIGHTTALTGAGISMFKAMTEQSVKPIIQMVNHNGGVKVGNETYKLELIVEDNKVTTAGARAALEKLIFRENVKYIVGEYVTVSLLGEIPLATENKVMMFIAAGGISPKPEYPYLFQNAPSFIQRLYTVVEVGKNKYPHLKRIATLNADDETGQSLQRSISKVFPQFGLEAVYNERHPRATKDYYPFLTKAIDQKPDAFLTITTPNEFAVMVKQLRQLGYKGPILYCSMISELDSFLKVAGDEASQGILAWYDDFNNPSANPRMREFQEFYTKVLKGSSEDVHYTPCVTSVQVLVQALEKANTFDTEKLVRVLETSEFDTVVGKCRFEGKETYGIARKLNSIFRVGELRGRKMVHVGEGMLREP